MNDKYLKLPKTLGMMIVSDAKDYFRRKKVLLSGTKTNDGIIAEYRRRNDIIYRAAVDTMYGNEELAEKLIEDVALRRGWQWSSLGMIMSHETFYARKRKMIYLVAKEYKLI